MFTRRFTYWDWWSLELLSRRTRMGQITHTFKAVHILAHTHTHTQIGLYLDFITTEQSCSQLTHTERGKWGKSSLKWELSHSLFKCWSLKGMTRVVVHQNHHHFFLNESWSHWFISRYSAVLWPVICLCIYSRRLTFGLLGSRSLVSRCNHVFCAEINLFFFFS